MQTQMVPDITPVMPTPSQIQRLSCIVSTKCDSKTEFYEIENKRDSV